MKLTLKLWILSLCLFQGIAYPLENEQEKEAYGPDSDQASPQIPSESEIRSQLQNRLNLVKVFSVEKNPGIGILDYRKGDRSEKILFGPSGGFYGLAMVFDGSRLPNQYGKNFKKDTIIQIALGRLKSRMDGQIPQFSAATLIGPTLPGEAVSYPVIIPQKGKAHSQKHMAFMLFSSPSTPNDQSDEQKLKGTFFAQNGHLTLSQNGRSKTIKVKSQGKQLWFKMYPLKVHIDVTLGTPFSTEQGSLVGTIQFPFYAPHGKEAMNFTQRIARESLQGTMSLSGSANSSSRTPSNAAPQSRHRHK